MEYRGTRVQKEIYEFILENWKTNKFSLEELARFTNETFETKLKGRVVSNILWGARKAGDPRAVYRRNKPHVHDALPKVDYSNLPLSARMWAEAFSEAMPRFFDIKKNEHVREIEKFLREFMRRFLPDHAQPQQRSSAPALVRPTEPARPVVTTEPLTIGHKLTDEEFLEQERLKSVKEFEEEFGADAVNRLDAIT